LRQGDLRIRGGQNEQKSTLAENQLLDGSLGRWLRRPPDDFSQSIRDELQTCQFLSGVGLLLRFREGGFLNVWLVLPSAMGRSKARGAEGGPVDHYFPRPAGVGHQRAIRRSVPFHCHFCHGSHMDCPRAIDNSLWGRLFERQRSKSQMVASASLIAHLPKTLSFSFRDG